MVHIATVLRNVDFPTQVFLLTASEKFKEFSKTAKADDILGHTIFILFETESRLPVTNFIHPNDETVADLSSVEDYGARSVLRDQVAFYPQNSSATRYSSPASARSMLQVISHKARTTSGFGDTRHAEYRLSTFKDRWTTSGMSEEHLAKAGFYYHRPNEVVCAFCHKILRGEVLTLRNKSAMLEHLRLNSMCIFVLGLDVGNVPLPVSMDDVKNCDRNLNLEKMPRGPIVSHFRQNLESIFYSPQFADYNVRWQTFMPAFIYVAQDLGMPDTVRGQVVDHLLQEGFYFCEQEGSKSKVRCFSCGFELPVTNELCEVVEGGGGNLSPLVYKLYFHKKKKRKCPYFKAYSAAEASLRAAEQEGSEVAASTLTRPRSNASRLIASLLETTVVKRVEARIPRPEKSSLYMALRENIFGCADILDDRLTEVQAEKRLTEAVAFVQSERELERALEKMQRSVDILEGKHIMNPGAQHPQQLHDQPVPQVPVSRADPEEQLCRVCFTNDINMVLNPCFHVVVCSECAQRLSQCPICRERIVSCISLQA